MNDDREPTPFFSKGSIPAPGQAHMPIHMENLQRLVDDPELRYEKTYTVKSSADGHRQVLLEAVDRMAELNGESVTQDSFQIVTRKEGDEDNPVFVVYAKYLPDNDRKATAA